MSEETGLNVYDTSLEEHLNVVKKTIYNFKQISEKNNLIIKSCCEDKVFDEVGIEKGSCIDVNLLNNVFGLNIKYEKDKSQRKSCLCNKSVDIGTYGTCKGGCLYCYAGVKK